MLFSLLSHAFFLLSHAFSCSLSAFWCFFDSSSLLFFFFFMLFLFAFHRVSLSWISFSKLWSKESRYEKYLFYRLRSDSPLLLLFSTQLTRVKQLRTTRKKNIFSFLIPLPVSIRESARLLVVFEDDVLLRESSLISSHHRLNGYLKYLRPSQPTDISVFSHGIDNHRYRTVTIR